MNNNNDGAKLWDNEELVMTALKVYGKHPRPQCFNEISRVCKLSNLRKSRYFHEKMMKNNPYEKKIRKLLADEGEETYPFFKIFFEEYKTKKERQKLMSYEEDKHNLSQVVTEFNMNKDHSHDYIDNSNDMHSNEDYYNESSLKNEEGNNYVDQYDVSINENDENYNDNDAFNIDNEPVTLSNITMQFHAENNQNFNLSTQMIKPLVDSNTQYLENLELKLKILNKEKDTMSDYFQTFSSVIDNLKNEINQFKSDKDTDELDETIEFNKKISELKEANVYQLSSKFEELNSFIKNLNSSQNRFSREQANLKEDLKVTKNFAQVENKKLQDELNECKAQLFIKDEQICDLKGRLEDSLRQNRISNSKHVLIQSSANYSHNKFIDLKENLERLFSHIQSLN